MKSIMKILTVIGMTAFISTSAMAHDRTSIDSLPAKGNVSVVGVVESIDGKNTVTLRDDTGRVQVKVTREEYEKLRVGEEVRATGLVKTHNSERYVEARSVINPASSKETDEESKTITDGNSTGEDMYKGSRGPDKE